MHDVSPRQVLVLVATIGVVVAALVALHYIAGGSALAGDIGHLVRTGIK